MAKSTPPCGTVAAYRRHCVRCEIIDQACRGAINAYARERRAALRVQKEPMICRRCGKTFTPKSKLNGGVCSQACSSVLNQRSLRPVIVPRPCLYCDEMFTPKHHDAEVCSRECTNLLSPLKRRGITVAEYRAMLDAQGHRCAICRCEEPPLDSVRRRDAWHIDHDHETGKVRGVLCPSCNLMLGYSRDNPEILIAAAGYLARG